MNARLKPSPRVAIYGRYSSHLQNENSAADQTRRCEEHAHNNGWSIRLRFNDEAMSGAENKRPGYLSLIAAVEAGEIDVVLAESLSRLTRNQTETARFFETCQFREVRIVTLSEGEITRMHVGMLGTMNSVFLENLAEATYRGMESRVIAGRSGGGRAYGYRVPVHSSGQPMVGELEIVEEEAVVIRRIFADYARGLSPRAIVAALNQEGIPSPHGKDRGDSKGDGKWRMNTLHGNRQRGTGILNNDLYAGKRIWNRLRYVKKPGEKARLSRLNPESEWRVQDVPQLRIVDEALWAAVRKRQDGLDQARLQKDRGDSRHLSGSHATRRPTYLLSGLVRCGCCGGTMNIAGSNPKRYFCANAREKGPTVCVGIPGMRKELLEQTVLDGLRHQLMRPEAVAEFIRRYRDHAAELDAERRRKAANINKGISRTAKEIDNIMKAIKAGIFTASTKQELERLEGEKARLEGELATASVGAPTLPENLAAIYHEKVTALVNCLNVTETRPEATEAIRALVDRIIVHWDAERKAHKVEIEGELAALLTLAQNEDAVAFSATASSLKLVAGAGFEPTTFRL